MNTAGPRCSRPQWSLLERSERRVQKPHSGWNVACCRVPSWPCSVDITVDITSGGKMSYPLCHLPVLNSVSIFKIGPGFGEITANVWMFGCFSRERQATDDLSLSIRTPLCPRESYLWSQCSGINLLWQKNISCQLCWWFTLGQSYFLVTSKEQVKKSCVTHMLVVMG